MENEEGGVGTMHVRDADKILVRKAESKRQLWTLGKDDKILLQ